MQIDWYSLCCRKRMRARSHVWGLVRVCLAKRTHQPTVFTLLNSLSSTAHQKGIRSLLQSGNCPRALSASASTVRLEQDRIAVLLSSGAFCVSGRYRILQRIVSQAKICYFYRRFKLIQRTAREGVNKCLGYKIELRNVSKNVPILDTKL